MKFEVDNIGLVDGDNICREISKWIDELDGSIFDSVIAETLSTVIDIIIDNMEPA